MNNYFRGFSFGVVAVLSAFGAFAYGDSFWYLFAFVALILAFMMRQGSTSYVTEERVQETSVTPDEFGEENVVVSRVSRRRSR